MKFFNKLRFKMLKGNRFTKYIIYALGEIILVVIGILIALWINNWNKEQQLEASSRNLQEKVLVQLNKDIRQIDKFNIELDTLNHIYLKILKRDHDKSKVDGSKVINTILFDVKDLGLSKQNVNWIDNATLNNSNASEILLNLSEIYKLYFKNINDIETIIYKKITSNLEYLEATQPWYTELITDFQCKNDCINYLLNNPGHQARIASLRLLYIENYKDLARGFYYDLKREKVKLEKTSDTSDK